jgi:hypothetical protein
LLILSRKQDEQIVVENDAFLSALLHEDSIAAFRNSNTFSFSLRTCSLMPAKNQLTRLHKKSTLTACLVANCPATKSRISF